MATHPSYPVIIVHWDADDRIWSEVINDDGADYHDVRGIYVDWGDEELPEIA